MKTFPPQNQILEQWSGRPSNWLLDDKVLWESAQKEIKQNHIDATCIPVYQWIKYSKAMQKKYETETLRKTMAWPLDNKISDKLKNKIIWSIFYQLVMFTHCSYTYHWFYISVNHKLTAFVLVTITFTRKVKGRKGQR